MRIGQSDGVGGGHVPAPVPFRSAFIGFFFSLFAFTEQRQPVTRLSFPADAGGPHCNDAALFLIMPLVPCSYLPLFPWAAAAIVLPRPP